MQRAAAKQGGVPAIHTLSPAHFAQIHAILQEGEQQELRSIPPGRVQGDSSHPKMWLWVCSRLIPAPKLSAGTLSTQPLLWLVQTPSRPAKTSSRGAR